MPASWVRRVRRAAAEGRRHECPQHAPHPPTPAATGCARATNRDGRGRAGGRAPGRASHAIGESTRAGSSVSWRCGASRTRGDGGSLPRGDHVRRQPCRLERASDGTRGVHVSCFRTNVPYFRADVLRNVGGDHAVGNPGRGDREHPAEPAGLHRLTRFELDVLYAQRRRTCGGTCCNLRDAGLPDWRISAPGAGTTTSTTNGPCSRHGTCWAGVQRHFHVLLAMRHDIEAIGTNGHELPMVVATLAQTRRAARLAVRSWPGGKRPTAATCSSRCPTLRHHAVPGRGPGWVTDWTAPHRLQGTLRWGQEAIAWWSERRPRSPLEVDPVLRRPGHATMSPATATSRAGSGPDSAGARPHQRLPGLPPPRAATSTPSA